MKQTIGVLGGDMRQVWLARLLIEDGYRVATWGLEQGRPPNGGSLSRAAGAEILILPLPVCRKGLLYLPLTDTQLDPETLWPKLEYHQLLIGGMTEELAPRLMADYGLTLIDYYDREETQIANAVPTAEGAVQLAMAASDRTILGSRCLVTGYGRIGRLLAERLQALGAEVTISARKYSDLAWAAARGISGLRSSQLPGALGGFEIIFNTVPACIFDAALLGEVREDCVLLDLAAAPGGFDAAAVERLGRRLITAPGLPGKAAPRTAAEAVRDSIYHILEERGEPI